MNACASAAGRARAKCLAFEHRSAPPWPSRSAGRARYDGCAGRSGRLEGGSAGASVRRGAAAPPDPARRRWPRSCTMTSARRPNRSMNTIFCTVSDVASTGSSASSSAMEALDGRSSLIARNRLAQARLFRGFGRRRYLRQRLVKPASYPIDLRVIEGVGAAAERPRQHLLGNVDAGQVVGDRRGLLLRARRDRPVLKPVGAQRDVDLNEIGRHLLAQLDREDFPVLQRLAHQGHQVLAGFGDRRREDHLDRARRDDEGDREGRHDGDDRLRRAQDGEGKGGAGRRTRIDGHDQRGQAGNRRRPFPSRSAP